MVNHRFMTAAHVPSPMPSERGAGNRALERLLDFFGFFKTHAGWAALIAAVNVIGIAYGFYYYRAQFAITPVWLWPFVPDSPLAVLWAELALVSYWLLRRRNRERTAGAWLDALGGLAVVGNVQVGLWTAYVLLAYADAFGTWQINLNTILLVAHVAMVPLGFLFLRGLRDRIRAVPARAAAALGGAATYYFVNDALDYFGPDYLSSGCGLRPITVPCDLALEPTLTAVTFALTALGLSVVAVTSIIGRNG